MTNPHTARRTAEARITQLDAALRLRPTNTFLSWLRRRAADDAMRAHAQIEREECRHAQT